MVAQTSAETLAALVDKSLLRYSETPGRYEMHDLVRQFAAEKLSAYAPEAAVCHSHYYLQLLANQGPALHGNTSLEAITILRPELGNLQSA